MPEPVVPSQVVIAVEEQKPVPMMQIAPDGVTPVPIASLGDAANTPPGADVPVGQVATGAQAASQVAMGTQAQSTTTTTTTAPVPATVTKGQGTTLTPNTTEEGDRVTAGQRHISRVWEYVQGGLAFFVTLTTLAVLAFLATSPMQTPTDRMSASKDLMVMAMVILTFYYQRTNHTREGGVGPKASEEYKGR